MRVQLQIDFNNSDSRYLEAITWENLHITNVSNPEVALTGVLLGAKGFQLSTVIDSPICRLDGSYKFFGDSGYPGILTTHTSDATGALSNSTNVRFYMHGDIVGKLYIVFDRVCQEWATEVVVKLTGTDSVTLSNDSPEMQIDLTEVFPDVKEYDGKVCLLQITKWSQPQSSVKITSIAIARKYIFGADKIQELSYSENSHDANLSVQSGIIAQYLDAYIYDRDKILHTLASQDMLFENCRANVQVIDGSDILSSEDYIITSWDVQPVENTVTIGCEDPTINFEKINVPAIPPSERTLDAILKYLFNMVPRLKWQYLDTYTQSDCEKIKIPNSWFLDDTLLNHLKKACAVGMLRIYYYSGTFYVVRSY